MGRNGIARAAPLGRHCAIHKQLLLGEVLKKRVKSRGRGAIALASGPCLQLQVSVMSHAPARMCNSKDSIYIPHLYVRGIKNR